MTQPTEPPLVVSVDKVAVLAGLDPDDATGAAAGRGGDPGGHR
jgi:hypothetical protein